MIRIRSHILPSEVTVKVGIPLIKILLLCLLTLDYPAFIVALGEEHYAGRSLSYWRGEFKKPNLAWEVLPLSFPFRKNPDPDSIPLLLALMEDSDSDVRGLAAASLGYLGRRAKLSIPNLITSLQDPIPFVRRNAALSLGRIGIGDAEVSRALRKALDDCDRRVCFFAAQSLWCITRQPQPTVDTLIKMLKSACPRDDVIFIYKLLNCIGPNAADAAPYLINVLNHNKDSGHRALAAETLGRIGACTHNSIASLRLALCSTDDSIRICAARSLWQITRDMSQSLPIFMEIAKSKDSGIYLRKIALLSLGELKGVYPEVDRVLRQMQTDPDQEISVSANAAIQQRKGNIEQRKGR